MLLRYETVESPAVAPSSTRKTTENTIVISAPIGFSQNESCSKRTWRSTSGRSRGTAEGATDRGLDRHCPAPSPVKPR